MVASLIKSKSRGKKKTRQLMRIDASISAPANLNVIHVEQNGGAHNIHIIKKATAQQVIRAEFHNIHAVNE